jgi:hypothetical protein
MRALTAAVLLAACGAPSRPAAAPAPLHNATAAPSARAPGDVVARLERSGCYGECAVYSVTIFGDGSVRYDGSDFVAVKGPREGRADAGAVERLRDAAVHAGFVHMQDFTSEDCTDLPGATITIDGHTVHHYTGDAHAPDSLAALELLVDTAAGDAVWVGKNAGGPYGSYCR